MTVLNRSAHKVLIKTGGAANVLGTVEHLWLRDFEASLMAEVGMWPVTISNADPGVSRTVIWFDPNGTTTTDAENSFGVFKISNDGATWITSPTAAQWRTWLQFYLAGSATTTPFTETNYYYNIVGPGSSQVFLMPANQGMIIELKGGYGGNHGGMDSAQPVFEYSTNGGTTYTAAANFSVNSSGYNPHYFFGAHGTFTAFGNIAGGFASMDDGSGTQPTMVGRTMPTLTRDATHLRMRMPTQVGGIPHPANAQAFGHIRILTL